MRKTLQRNGQPLQRFRRNVSTNWLRCFLSASHRAVSAACRTSAASGASAAFGFTDANDPIGDGIWRHPDDPGWISMGGAFGFSDIAFNPGAQGDCFSPVDALRDICLTAVASAGSTGGLPPFAEPVTTQSYRYWGASDCAVWKLQPESCPDQNPPAREHPDSYRLKPSSLCQDIGLTRYLGSAPATRSCVRRPSRTPAIFFPVRFLATKRRADSWLSVTAG